VEVIEVSMCKKHSWNLESTVTFLSVAKRFSITVGKYGAYYNMIYIISLFHFTFPKMNFYSVVNCSLRANHLFGI